MWLRQKARSKAGSPNHAHSASKKTGPNAPQRMFFGLTSPCTKASFVLRSHLDKGLKLHGAIGMNLCRRAEVRFQPDGEEDVIGRKLDGNVVALGSMGVDQRDSTSNFGSECWLHYTIAKLRLPHRVAGGLQVLHSEHGRACVLSENVGCGAGHDGACALQPLDFPPIAFDWRAPVGLDP